ncbi:MAG: PCMD domain-containing protein [Duncaniella sp.]|nr:PCMD domain-containing protein [Duncaniella sp.]
MSRFRYISLLLLAVTAAVLTGCIKNNIPYPYINVNFTTFDVEGSERPSAIDSIQRTVTVYLTEDVDIRNVVVNGFTLSPADGVWADSAAYLNGIDMSSPLTTVLSLYQDYTWTITARQEIERYFTVEQQVGASVIDVPGHRIIAYVAQSAPINSLLVTSIKLAGGNAVMTPDLSGQRTDFTAPVHVDVTQYGRTERWTIYVVPTEETVTTERVDAWSCVAWLYGSAEEGKDNGFEYRRADSDSWVKLTADQLTIDGGSFTGRLTGLSPLTSYVARAYSDADYGAEIEFTTQGTAQLPNSDFEQWWLDGKVWDPWAEGGESFWDTGNKGATTLGTSNTYPSDDTPTGKGRSACLETRFVGIGPVGKLAAGNIFAGKYVKTDGTNGILSFGRPWTTRPTRLRGWMKYHSAAISSTTVGYENLKGEPDTGIIWIALIDTDEPFEIRTNPNNRQLFDPDGPAVVAYGKAEWNTDVTEWTRFEITLDYKSTSRVPKYLLCTGSASALGDYFTGGNGSVLMIDDFELMFDY